MQLLNKECFQKIAISCEKNDLTFAELEASTQKMSLKLQKLPKGIVVLQASFNPVFIIQLLAALKIDKPIAILSPQEFGEEKRAILGTHMTVNEYGDLLEFRENKIPYHSKLALILFTSGSTGQTKAVQLSQKNIMANCKAVINVLEFSRIRDQLLFLPLSYSFGLLGQLVPALISGIKTQLIGEFTEIKTILENGNVPQMWSGVPSHWVAINKMGLLYPEHVTKISTIVSAGATLPISLRNSLLHTFSNATIYNNYGLTEASPRVLTYSSKDPLFLENYAGYPIGNWQATLSDDNELLIKGNQLMLGYLGEKNPDRMQNDWFFTGDIAEIHPSGLIAIKGRIDQIINIGGEKINVLDMEHKICQIKEIKEVIVLPLTDDLYGMSLIACLERSTFNYDITEHFLTERVKQHLLPKKIPIRVIFVNNLPRNQHGKIDRKALLLSQKEKIDAH